MTKISLVIPALILGWISDLRNWLFSVRVFESKKVSSKILSIGNLTVGGSGKTPFAHWLSQYLVLRNIRVAILSRGYGRKLRGFRRVEAGEPSLYGDEPSWLAANLKNVPVFVGEDRVKACKKILEQEDPTVILLDDGFQHRWLKRDLDFVLLDATEDPKNYQMFPVGRAREKWNHLKRASVAILTKVNLGEEQNVNWVRYQVSQMKKPMVEFILKMKSIRPVFDGPRLDSKGQERCLLVSGIANPKSFFQVVQSSQVPFEIVGHLKFKDHHDYTEKDLREIVTQSRKLNSSYILVTEKDAGKIKILIEKLSSENEIRQLASSFYSVVTEFEMVKGQEVLSETLDKLGL